MIFFILLCVYDLDLSSNPWFDFDQTRTILSYNGPPAVINIQTLLNEYSISNIDIAFWARNRTVLAIAYIITGTKINLHNSSYRLYHFDCRHSFYKAWLSKNNIRTLWNQVSTHFYPPQILFWNFDIEAHLLITPSHFGLLTVCLTRICW